MKVTFCGVRGSMPAPGVDFLRYGGQTSCVAISVHGETPDLLLDAGTGMVAVTPLLYGAPFVGSVLIGHLHWDHTQGMPFFAGGLEPGSRVHVMIPAQDDPAVTVLERFFSPPIFPIVPTQLGEGWSFDGLEEGAHLVEGYHVLAREIPHKGGRTFGFRVERDGHTLAYLSDHSPISVGPGPDGLGERHDAVRELAQGADLLIHDSQFLAAQSPRVDFLGHASVEYTVALAAELGVPRVALFHHSPTRTDDEIDEILLHARDIAPDGVEVVAAYEGLEVNLGERFGALPLR